MLGLLSGAVSVQCSGADTGVLGERAQTLLGTGQPVQSEGMLCVPYFFLSFLCHFLSDTRNSKRLFYRTCRLIEQNNYCIQIKNFY
jgi:hypothetical protein